MGRRVRNEQHAQSHSLLGETTQFENDFKSQPQSMKSLCICQVEVGLHYASEPMAPPELLEKKHLRV